MLPGKNEWNSLLSSLSGDQPNTLTLCSSRAAGTSPAPHAGGAKPTYSRLVAPRSRGHGKVPRSSVRPPFCQLASGVLMLGSWSFVFLCAHTGSFWTYACGCLISASREPCLFINGAWVSVSLWPGCCVFGDHVPEGTYPPVAQMNGPASVPALRQVACSIPAAVYVSISDCRTTPVALRASSEGSHLSPTESDSPGASLSQWPSSPHTAHWGSSRPPSRGCGLPGHDSRL